MTRSFPDGFRWGAATAAYQIEGAVHDDGRGPSIWDTFAHTPGRVLHGDHGDVACDHYHRMPQDVALLRDLGLSAYRFSVSWPRVQPTGSAPANPAGLAFYDRLVDELLAAGIEPMVTLYHWDLPQPLQDAGGWPARATASRFADYASLVASALGDRVRGWLTINEPWCAAYLGYASGEHAPGLTDPRAAFDAVHHLNLAHAWGADAVRSVAPGAQVGVALNLQVNRAAGTGPDDEAAKRRVDLVANEVFLQPLLGAGYPAELADATAHLTDWSVVRDGDEAAMAGRTDLLGLNYYTTATVRAGSSSGPTVTAGGPVQPLGPTHPSARPNPNLACEDVEWLAPEGPVTEMGWGLDPAGLTQVLVELHERFGLPLYVTENGAAYADVVGPDGVVHDEERTSYLRTHLAAVAGAIDAGADVRGYYAWSLMDNFEWALGYSKRFGLVHVDYDTLERTPKDSARWYAQVARTGVLPAAH